MTTICVKITDGLRASQHSFGEKSQIWGPLTAKKEKARDINDKKPVKWDVFHRLVEMAGVEIFFSMDNNHKNNLYLLHENCFQALCS